MAYFDKFWRRFGRSTPAPSNAPATSGAEDQSPHEICIRLDRRSESRQVRSIVDQLVRSPARVGVVFLCGSSDDSVIDFIDRLRFWDLHEWLNPSNDTTEVQISPHRKQSVKPFMVEGFGSAGLLTGWALEEFGERFADDAAVLQRLCQEPKFFVITIAEERQATPAVDLKKQLDSFHALVTSETHDPGQCVGLLLFVWVQKGQKDVERLLELKQGLAPLSAQEIATFTPVQPPHLDAWWPDVYAAQRRFRDDVDLATLRQQIIAELFDNPDGRRQEVPMQRALAVLTSELRKQTR